MLLLLLLLFFFTPQEAFASAFNISDYLQTPLGQLQLLRWKSNTFESKIYRRHNNLFELIAKTLLCLCKL